jgi:hypothetical protein
MDMGFVLGGDGFMKHAWHWPIEERSSPIQFDVENGDRALWVDTAAVDADAFAQIARTIQNQWTQAMIETELGAETIIATLDVTGSDMSLVTGTRELVPRV